MDSGNPDLMSFCKKGRMLHGDFYTMFLVIDSYVYVWVTGNPSRGDSNMSAYMTRCDYQKLIK